MLIFLLFKNLLIFCNVNVNVDRQLYLLIITAFSQHQNILVIIEFSYMCNKKGRIAHINSTSRPHLKSPPADLINTKMKLQELKDEQHTKIKNNEYIYIIKI